MHLMVCTVKVRDSGVYKNRKATFQIEEVAPVQVKDVQAKTLQTYMNF